jgi:hypothetical protein
MLGTPMDARQIFTRELFVKDYAKDCRRILERHMTTHAT